MTLHLEDKVPGQEYDSAVREKFEQLRAFRASHPYKNVTLNGVKWQYIASGRGDEALLILGGAFAVGESAFRTIRRYEGQFRIVSPSYPPVGDVRKVVDGLAALLDLEGIERTHIFGHSLGSAVAHRFVRRHAERVDKLILSDFGLYTGRRVLAVRLLYRLLPLSIIRLRYRRVPVRLTRGIADKSEREFMRAYLRELLDQQFNPATVASQFRLLVSLFDTREEYGTFKQVERPGRVLIMLALDDRGFTQKERERLIATYPGQKCTSFRAVDTWWRLTDLWNIMRCWTRF